MTDPALPTPAPSDRRMPPPPPAPQAPPAVPRPPNASSGWSVSLPRLSAPGWLAATGATLLLTASVIVVAGRWESIGQTARFSGLVGALLAIYFAAEAGRTRIRTTASALAVLAACLTAPVGIAAAAALEATWPIAILVGGLIAVVAAEVQSHRWHVRSLKAATVIAAGLAATGAAALSDVPVALLGAGLAALALAVGAERRSIVLAAAIPFVPFLNVLAEAGVGVGTLERIGAIGSQTAWVAPLSALIAGAVIAVTAHRRDETTLGAAAIAVTAWGAAIGITTWGPSAAVWFCVPAALAMIIGITAFGADQSIFGRWARDADAASISALAAIGVALPAVVSLATAAAREFGDGSLADYRMPLAATAVAAVFGALTSRRSTSAAHDRAIIDLALVGALGATLAALPAFDVHLLWVAVAALVTWAVSSVVTAWRHWIPVTGAHVAWAVIAAHASVTSPDAATPLQISIIVIVAAALMIVACSWTTSTYAPMIGIPSAVATAVVLVGHQFPERLTTIAAVLAVVAAASTSLAMRTARFGAADALAISTAAVALGVSFGTTPAGVSLALVLVSGQAWLYAVSQGRVEAAWISGGVGAASMLSLWWTTGTNQLAIEWLEPYGIDGQDLAIGAVSTALLLAGLAVRRTARPSTWLAYGPGLGTAIAWLLLSQTDVGGGWAATGALLVGVAAVAIGGFRRLGAPLVFGTISLLGTGIVSAGPRLAEAPTWLWIAGGGALLLVIAAAIERSERPLLPLGDGSGVESVLEAFRHDFE